MGWRINGSGVSLPGMQFCEQEDYLVNVIADALAHTHPRLGLVRLLIWRTWHFPVLSMIDSEVAEPARPEAEICRAA